MVCLEQGVDMTVRQEVRRVVGTVMTMLGIGDYDLICVFIGKQEILIVKMPLQV